MATLNDFKLVNKLSDSYFNYFEKAVEDKPYSQKIKDLYDTDKSRFGFYFLILESVTGQKDIDDNIKDIIDTEFTNVISDKDTPKNNDYGIDAVNINYENSEINLFNFKFRENYKQQSGQKGNTVSDSMKFLSFIMNTPLQDLNSPKTLAKLEEINKNLDSKEVWNINLYIASNENKPIDIEEEYIKNLKNTLDIKIQTITIDDIINFTSLKPEEISSHIVFDESKVMKYEESELSSSKSYLVSMNILDLIRITCKDISLRENAQLDDYSNLSQVELNEHVLFDNVRGYLGKTAYNKNIIQTLRDEPSKFFLYNNGITLTAKSIDANPVNANRSLSMYLNNFQIVNGGQTLKSIYELVNQNFNEESLSNASILVRIFQTSEDEELTNNIAEYTNSQNAISVSDLKSVSNLQISIERFLKEHDIKYIRKAGETPEDDREYKHRISMERMGQILYSKQGRPDRATNQKKRIFDSYYDEIFSEDLDFEELAAFVEEYFAIKHYYENSEYESYDQKYFYVLYLNKFKSHDLEKNTNLIEKSLQEYKSEDNNLSFARKLIQKGFKDHLDNKAQIVH